MHFIQCLNNNNNNDDEITFLILLIRHDWYQSLFDSISDASSSIWLYESDKSNKAMRSVKNYNWDVNLMKEKSLFGGRCKLFETRSVVDKRRVGRPSGHGSRSCARRRTVCCWQKNHNYLPCRKRAAEISIPQTSLLRRILKKICAWGLETVSSAIPHRGQQRKQSSICCQAIFHKYDIPGRREKLLFTDECDFYGDDKRVNCFSEPTKSVLLGTSCSAPSLCNGMHGL